MTKLIGVKSCHYFCSFFSPISLQLYLCIHPGSTVSYSSRDVWLCLILTPASPRSPSIIVSPDFPTPNCPTVLACHCPHSPTKSDPWWDYVRLFLVEMKHFPSWSLYRSVGIDFQWRAAIWFKSSSRMRCTSRSAPVWESKRLVPMASILEAVKVSVRGTCETELRHSCWYLDY